MAVTQNSYTRDGSATNYSFTFPYLDKSDVKVRINGVTQATTAYSFANATTITMGSAGSSGDKLVVFRDTNNDAKKATFYAGSAIKSEDLNDNYDQILYVAQEVDNNAMTTDGTTTMTANLPLGEDVAIVFEGGTDDAHETTLTVTDPTADRTITLPNETGTVITSASTDVVDSAHYVAGSIDLEHMSANSIDSAQYVDGSIDTEHLSADVIVASKIADNAIQTEHLTASVVATANIADDAVTNDKLAGNAVYTSAIQANAVTQGKMAANSVDSDQYVDGSIDRVHLAADIIDGTKIADDSINSEHYIAGSIDTEHVADSHVTTAKLQDAAVTTVKIANSSVDSTKLANASVVTDRLADNSVATAKIQDNAVTTAKIADADLKILAGMQGATASILAGSTALTSTLTELNQLDGKTLGETTLTTNSDTAIPTSKAVNDRILTITNALGGFVAIADKDNFPTSNPDPSDGAGTVVSITDAAGISVNSSGVGSLATRAGGSDAVIINGFPSALRGGATVGGATNANPYVLPSSVGLQVQTTSTAHTYDYHKYFINEEDANKLSGNIQDFQERYRVASSAPTSSKDNGDLWFDTANAKMMVYNSATTSWEEVTSTGSFNINTISSYSGTGGNSATFDGTAYRFVLSHAPTEAQQLIVSINGVVQKPNSGTSQPSEGFVIDGTSIIFSNAPPSGSDYFIVTIGSSVDIGSPSDNSVATAKIQNLAVTGDKIATNLDLADNKKIRFGTGNDLELYHDGTNSFIDNTTGSVNIRGASSGSGWLILQAKEAENSLICKGDGAVELYHDNTKSVETVSGGILVKGIEGGNCQIYMQADEGDDNADKWLINALASGSILQIGNYNNGSSWETNIECNGDGNVELYYDNVKKLETKSTGVKITGDAELTGDLLLKAADGQKIYFGPDNDMQIWHDGSHSYIKNSVGNLYLTPLMNEEGINIEPNGQVNIFYDNSKKAYTYANGLALNGNLSLRDSDKLVFGSGNDLEIYHDGTNSYIKSEITGHLNIDSQYNQYFRNQDGSETRAVFVNNGSCELYHDNVKKFETQDVGIRVWGRVYVEDNMNLEMGDAADFKLYHNGSHSYIKNDTGHLVILSDTFRVNDKDNLENLITADEGGSVNLYYDGSQKFRTMSGACEITGHCQPSADANGTNIGQSSLRWTNIFASNAPINTSDRNEKNTIQDCDLGLSFIEKLKPVSYKWNNEEAGTKTNYGLIAQDLLEVIEEEGKPLDDFGPIHKEEGSSYGLSYTQLISPLIKAVQELSAEVNTLKTKVAELEAK